MLGKMFNAIFFLLLLVFSLICSFFVFLRQRVHFLLALLALELVVVFVPVIVILGGGCGRRRECLVFIMLAVSACEARLGLRLLVFIVRRYGNDLVSSLVGCKF